MIPNLLILKRLAILLALSIGLSVPAFGASFRTQNFIVTADTAEHAEQIAQRAEDCRERLAVDWFGIELPPWNDPCPILAMVGQELGVQGQTTFVFQQGQPTSWQMEVQGPRSVLLRSVVPHEVAHTIFATYFGRRLPRWAEEGACVSVEHRRDLGNLEDLLPSQLDLGKVMTLDQMFNVREYPTDILPLYAQGYSLVCFLLTHGDKRKFVDFLSHGMKDGNWALAAQTHYGHATLDDLQQAWLQWAAPPLQRPSTLVASASK